MNKYDSMNDNICTLFELKQFAFTHDPSAWNFARWIESKNGTFSFSLYVEKRPAEM
jgi:hypothetical protein